MHEIIATPIVVSGDPIWPPQIFGGALSAMYWGLVVAASSVVLLAVAVGLPTLFEVVVLVEMVVSLCYYLCYNVFVCYERTIYIYIK